jgi:hypothetical protein
MAWQLLFNYLPPEKANRESVLLEKQKKYPQFLNYFLLCLCFLSFLFPLILRRYTELLAHATALRNEELTSQIDMDVLRTMPEGHEVLFGNPAVKQVFERCVSVILYLCVQSVIVGSIWYWACCMFLIYFSGVSSRTTCVGCAPPRHRLFPRPQ